MSTKTSQTSVTEPQREIQVLYDADVIVAGGGIAGTFAALSAASEGADTVLIDRFGAPGGNFGPGMINNGGVGPRPADLQAEWPVCTHIKGGFKGLGVEFYERHATLTGAALGYATESSAASYLALKMCRERGVKLLLSTYAADPILEGNRVAGMFVEGKSGRAAVRSKVVIDATGEADVARRAGAPILYPKPEYTDVDHHSPTGAGLCSYIVNVDWSPYDAWQEEEGPTDEKKAWAEETLGYYDDKLSHLIPCIRKALDNGEDRANYIGALFKRELPGIGAVKSGLIKPATEPGCALGRTGFLRPDMGDTEQVSETEAMARTLLFESYLFYREYVPGFDKAVFVCTAPYLGARGGPCIEGEVTLRTEDFVEGTRFDDVVFVFGHVSGGKDISKGDGQWADYPFRVMLPKEIDGLIAVGRCASAIPDTLIRGRYKAVPTGQIGGMAAAMCAGKGVTPRELDVRDLQRRLLKEGFHLGDEERLKELGLASE